METGTLIKKFRTEKKLTQKQLGELCIPPIAESTIRRYKLGKLNPKIETLIKISDALEIPFYHFYIDTSDEQLQRLMCYFTKLNSLGLSKIEQQLQDLIKDENYLKN